MRAKQYAFTVMVLLAGTLIIAQISDKIFAAQSGQTPKSREPHSGSTNPATLKWEYRVLAYPPRTRITGRSYDERGLEQEINQLAEQGYVVESFHPLSPVVCGDSPGSGGFSLESNTRILVLLKREKK